MLSNNIVYTAISRAEEKVYHFSDVKTINIAMNKSDSDKRNTFLRDMLKEIKNIIDNFAKIIYNISVIIVWEMTILSNY